MKIVPIFAEKLYSIHYDEEKDNEYDRLLDQWNDAEYLNKFLIQHEPDWTAHYDYTELVENILDSVDFIDRLLFENEYEYDQFFKPLHDQDPVIRILNLSKGKRKCVRLYAIRVDRDCFVITGGALKFTRAMQQRPHTQLELDKLNRISRYLKDNGVIDQDSFFEFINELS